MCSSESLQCQKGVQFASCLIDGPRTEQAQQNRHARFLVGAGHTGFEQAAAGVILKGYTLLRLLRGLLMATAEEIFGSGVLSPDAEAGGSRV